jgi:hypothetical protein
MKEIAKELLEALGGRIGGTKDTPVLIYHGDEQVAVDMLWPIATASEPSMPFTRDEIAKMIAPHLIEELYKRYELTWGYQSEDVPRGFDVWPFAIVDWDEKEKLADIERALSWALYPEQYLKYLYLEDEREEVDEYIVWGFTNTPCAISALA